VAELSPSAQAVKDAVIDVCWLFHPAQTAAALRAAADQLYDSPSQDYLWAIAAELDNTNNIGESTKDD
jgi:hypothetical protein